MKLYKNVDICDLESILNKGILSLDESGNDNWLEGKRAKNSTNVVYLFSPISELNTFPTYGAVLLEVDVDNASKREMVKNDAHIDEYDEYTVERVAPENIVAIYIPELFRPYINVPESIMSRITWCGISATRYVKGEFIPASKDTLLRFAETAPLNDSSTFNFFRGINEKGQMLDLYEFKYLI